MSKISNERHILFGTSDLSINGIYCTSEQHSFKKKIIDKQYSFFNYHFYIVLALDFNNFYNS
ncbi:hypothetical protein RhiirA1_487090 [Rhizophagus irregularis]|uniref:Uncharacterized protein n=1 Tax=Rhizophagus irregularis TaxID=588596 RepID=A0A2N0QGL0_9GLOM|nr:hypothetical protein RhiirA1_487090 [Rhizophagus irregularis]